MDEKTVKYGEERFNEIKTEVGAYLATVGYKVKKI